MEQLFNSSRTQPIKMMLLGAGELGKEVVIEAQRLGVTVVAVDRYPEAPAMHVADDSEVVDMTDAKQLRQVIERHQPDLVVPEIEAIATSVLVELEQQGQRVVPTATAAHLTMDREGIRKLAAEELEVVTSPYEFVDDRESFLKAVDCIGMPCVVKPIMSSSGKGQSTIKTTDNRVNVSKTKKCANFTKKIFDFNFI